MEKLKGQYPPFVLSDKINELIDSHNKMVEAIKYLVAECLDTPDGELSDKINEILNS